MLQHVGWTLDEWRQAYRDGSLSPRSALHALRAQLQADDPAWIHIVSSAELDDQLDQLQTGADTLPLYGIPFVAKDNIDAAGLPTTAACPAFAYTASTDATSVARLRAAGAILLAKTNLDQFATGLVGTRSPYGAVPNSFNPTHVSGGSSSGSAVAVARGLVPFSLGTDTAGSGRVPAGFNNIVGLKPTRGRFSTQGVLPACRSLDCVSVFALSVDDAETVAGVLEGFDPADSYSRHAQQPARLLGPQPRFGIPAQPQWFGDHQAEAAWQAALAGFSNLPAELVELDFSPMLELAQLLYGGPWVAERYAAIQPFLATQAEQVDPVVRDILSQASRFSAIDTFQAEYRRAELTRQIHQLMGSVDALLVPTAPTLPTLDAVNADPITENSQLGLWTNFVNLADCSALALPAGLRADGLPFGITLIGMAWQDAALADIGRRWQAHAPWKRGTTDLPLPASQSDSDVPEGYTRLAVVGAHLQGMPLNSQLTERHARFVEATHSASHYRLYALPDTTPPKPGLIRSAAGAPIAMELWDVPTQLFGSFVALIPAPLGIGTITLVDGREVKGFICEGAAIEGATDITHLGGWRAYIASRS
ncbi:MAG: allophanate hydrolase [Pseudomonas sp.]